MQSSFAPAMKLQSRIPSSFGGPDAQAQPGRPGAAAKIQRQGSDAEDADRLVRLEESLAIQEQSFGEAMASNEHPADEVARRQQLLQQAADRLAAAEDARDALASVIEERDGQIAELEDRLQRLALADADAHRARVRMHALRGRVRARLVAQAEEIAGLRRTLAIGHAARKQVEEELEALREEARREAPCLGLLGERRRDSAAS